jgi:hypothetical protein
MTRTLHWYKINRMVVQRLWDSLAHQPQSREIIANDTTHSSDMYKWFIAHSDIETNRYFQSDDFEYNQKYSFKG